MFGQESDNRGAMTGLSTTKPVGSPFMVAVAAISFTITVTHSTAADHLLLSEILTTPDAAEFVEIVNPTDRAIALDRYFLCDDQEYALIPGAFGGNPDPDVSGQDFIVRFPAGAVIEPNGVVVVAINGIGFFNTFGFRADFEVRGTDALTPDMIAVFDASSAALSPSECMTLCRWDGASDLVKDVDLLRWGSPTDSNNLTPKTGVMVDGPDADRRLSTYLNDAFTIPTPGLAPDLTQSVKRIADEDGHEVDVGGNGITGHDETTENILATWDFSAMTAPNPGLANLALAAPPAIVINEIHYDPDSALGDANGDSTVNADDTFIELINNAVNPIDLAGFTISNATGVHHVFPAKSILEPCQAVVVFSAGSPLGDFGNAVIQLASTGSLDLNNAADSITLRHPGGFIVSAVSYDQGDIDQSIVRSPDVTGESFVLHMNASAASGGSESRFSPGTRVDDSAFSPCSEDPSCLGDLVTSATFQPPPDGEVDGADLGYLLSSWGNNPGSPADIVSGDTFEPPPDGNVDGADLGVLLSRWGACK